ncbi:PhzF family phenazine biosynthesis protein [Albidovulum sediminis]|uniref:PhzF family phenazine biosynthesis protein n=1 Tax=Albidovulum sediminis TaxID=3066345 RepID=A0ABT2NNF3_9RHOB|nr:PhzF family phenazine biosynthesis protein [Defluviimonas sediminis]MCT8330446.1 PhzF family phenazine biosynthesis protein [Defluviimonas sediminis]
MTEHEFDWVDAFTDRPFGGNGCAVFHQAGAIDAGTCMAIVRETSLTECTYLEPSAVADFRVRYFLADREIPFAGHPTIATVASLLERGMASGDSLTLETLAGVIGVEILAQPGAMPQIVMTQIAPEFREAVPPAEVAAVSGIEVDDIVGTPQIVTSGLPYCVTVVRSAGVLGRMRLDLAAMKDFSARYDRPGDPVMEPYLVALEGATPAGRTFARHLMAPPSPAEDPFTGSAAGPAAAYLWRHGMIECPRFVAEQGHLMGRPGHAQIEVLGPREAITGVRVGGQGRVLMQGRIRL